jgi:hypothetical protein
MHGLCTLRGGPSASEVARIRHSLDELLGIITDHSETYVWPHDGNFSHDPSPISAILLDPIGRSLRLGARLMGERLPELGGTDLMRDVLHAVADLDQSNAGRRMSICDHAWNAVGSDGRDVWWA